MFSWGWGPVSHTFSAGWNSVIFHTFGEICVKIKSLAPQLQGWNLTPPGETNLILGPNYRGSHIDSSSQVNVSFPPCPAVLFLHKGPGEIWSPRWEHTEFGLHMAELQMSRVVDHVVTWSFEWTKWMFFHVVFLPGPSSLGANWCRYRASIHHPLWSNWHPLEGAGMFFLLISLPRAGGEKWLFINYWIRVDWLIAGCDMFSCQKGLGMFCVVVVVVVVVLVLVLVLVLEPSFLGSHVSFRGVYLILSGTRSICIPYVPTWYVASRRVGPCGPTAARCVSPQSMRTCSTNTAGKPSPLRNFGPIPGTDCGGRGSQQGWRALRGFVSENSKM